MNNKFGDSKLSLFNSSPSISYSNFAHHKPIKLQTRQKNDPLSANRKIFHSPAFSNVSEKISNFDINPRKLSIQYEKHLSTETSLPFSCQNKGDSHRKLNFFVPSFNDSNSKFLQKIKNTYEKKFQLINDAELKRFNSSCHEENSYFSNKTTNFNENVRTNGFINFAEINTSKGDDRSGSFFRK